jgi:anti-anti-sigma regulatory factor
VSCGQEARLTPTINRDETRWRVRLEGDLTLASAAALKSLLLEWLASGKDLELDLESAEEIDITSLQLLWAAGREAARAGAGIVSRVSGAVDKAARDAGLEPFPGTTFPR